jgi:hypothetical protein
VGENDDRGGIGFAFDIVGEPRELLGSKSAEPACLKVHHIVKTYEMYAVVVEAVPALTLGAFAVAFEIELAQALVDEVVLARNVVHVEARLSDQLRGAIELIGLRQMGNVPGVNHEGGLRFHRLHLGDRLAQGAECIGIGGFVEADMAVADLQEGEAGRLCCQRLTQQSHRLRYPAR